MSRTLLPVAFLLSIVALAQPAPKPPAFEAADVHTAKPGGSDRFAFIYGGRAEFRGSTMLTILAAAFRVDEDMIAGGPDWLGSARFDISAKSKPSTSDDTVRTMLLALLQERFKLKTHSEDRPMPAYVLSISKRGSKLKPASGEGPPGCDGIPNPPPLISVVCKSLNASAIAFNFRQMANAYVNRPLIDETGLKGSYDFNLSWTPRGQLKKPSDPDYDPAKHTPFFDAVEKQLGLKIDPQTRPVPVIVIDSVEEKPLENSDSAARPPAPTEFEVASLRPSRPGVTEINGRFLPGGQLELTNMPVKEMIKLAYNVRDDGVAGVPKWAESDRYDLSAKAGSIVPPEILRVMFQNLLAERFGLKLHSEDQPISVYALTGKGAKLKEAAESERSGCKRSAVDGMPTYTCQKTTMAQFAEDLRNIAPGWVGDHPVVDATGLTGSYDFVVKWSPRARFANQAGRVGDASSAAGPAAADPTGDITFFEAIDKQLGLKVAIQKRAMPVLVIDQLNRTPVDN